MNACACCNSPLKAPASLLTPKSHRRQLTPALRLTYVFSLAQQLEKLPAQQVSDEVLAHLEEAQAVFQTIFGHAEWEHLHNQEFTFGKLTGKPRDDLAVEVGPERFEALAGLPMDEIPAEDKADYVQALGKLSQNRIYRQLLLGTITESWVEYLTRMEALRVSISMESYAQRDPLVQYKSQASTMFTELLSEVRQTVIGRIFRVRPSYLLKLHRACAMWPALSPKPYWWVPPAPRQVIHLLSSRKNANAIRSNYLWKYW